MTTVSETLYKAADLIERRGWTRGFWNTDKDDAPLCLEGGIAAAMGVVLEDEAGRIIESDYDSLLACPAYQAVRSYLGDRLRPNSSLFTWNDSPARKSTDVIETLRAAAVIEAARESEAAKVGASA